MPEELTAFTSTEAAKKAETQRVFAAGEKAAQKPGNDWWRSIQEKLIDPATGEMDSKKIAILGGGGVLGLLLGSLGGPVFMAIGGAIGAAAAYLGVDAILSLFNLSGKEKAAIPPTLPKPVGLKPTSGFNTHMDVHIPELGAGSLPSTDPFKNPMPEHDLREVERLRRKAESEAPYNNPNNQKMRDMVNELQLMADQWEVNLRSTRKHFSHYNTKLYPCVERFFREKYGADTWHCSLNYLIPQAPLHPTIYSANGGADGYDALSPSLEHYGAKIMGLKRYGRDWNQLSQQEQLRARNEWNYNWEDTTGWIERDVVEKRNIVYNYAKEKARQYEVALKEALDKLNNPASFGPNDSPLNNLLRGEPYKEVPFKLLIKDDRSLWQSVNPFDESQYQQMMDNLQSAYQLYKKDARAGLEKMSVIFEMHRDMMKDEYKKFVDSAIEGGKAYGALREFDAYLEKHLYPNIDELKHFAKYGLPEHNKQVQLFKEKMKGLEKTGVLFIGESVSDEANVLHGNTTQNREWVKKIKELEEQGKTAETATLHREQDEYYKRNPLRITHYFYDARKSQGRQAHIVTYHSTAQPGATDEFHVYLGARFEPFKIKLDRKDDTLVKADASVEAKTKFSLMLMDKAEHLLQKELKTADVHILRTEAVQPASYEAKRKEWDKKEEELVAGGKSYTEAAAIIEPEEKEYYKKNPRRYIVYIRDMRDPNAPHDVEIRITHDTPMGYGSKDFDVRFDGKGEWIKVSLDKRDDGLETSGTEPKKRSARIIIDKAMELLKSKDKAKVETMGHDALHKSPMFDAFLLPIMRSVQIANLPTAHDTDAAHSLNIPFQSLPEGRQSGRLWAKC